MTHKSYKFFFLIILTVFLFAGNNALALLGGDTKLFNELKSGETEEAEETEGETKTEESSSKEKTPWQETRPNIEIPIPGFIGFSEVKIGEDRYVDIPWIGEYIVAIFNWLMMIVGGVATVMIMIGGFLYLTAAGNQGQVGKAKEMITNALIGLLLAVGSYLILYTINPDLISFKNIRLGVIEREEMEFEFEGVGFGTYNIMRDSGYATGTTRLRRRSQYCRFIAPPDIFRRPRTELRLDRINIRGENETRCPGGVIYTREIVDATLAAQRATGIPAGFLLAQAQHETRGFRTAIEAGEVPSMLWGRKCPYAPLSGAAREVYINSQPTCTLARQPSSKSQLDAACRPPRCQVLRTIEPCREGSNQTVPTWACFTNFEGVEGGIAGAAMSQATFYRDRIGRSCSHCGAFEQYEGSVMGFAARMSCSLFGGFLNSKWDNCLYNIIKTNCLEDSRNADLITLSEILGPSRGACVGGVDARDPEACRDPYDSAKIANPRARWCASTR